MGTLIVEGDYEQDAGGTLAIAVDGTNPGQYSTLFEPAVVTLGGTLELEPSAAYANSASVGDEMPFLPYLNSETGAFSLITSNPQLSGGKSFTVVNVGNNSEDIEVVGPAQPPSSTAPPVLSGTAQDGDQLSTTNGTWTNNPTSFTYQWEDCPSAAETGCTPIANATQSSYTLTAGDVGRYVTAVVYAHDAAAAPGDATAVPPKGPVTAPVQEPPTVVSAPTLTGTALPGDTLTCDPGTWTGEPTFTYSWQRNSDPISGATSSTYVVTILDEGRTITCTVNAAGPGGIAAATSTAKIVAQPGTLACPKPSGLFSPSRIRALSLGATKGAARSALRDYKVIGYGFDNFCLYGGWGIRAAYKSQRIVLLLTANPFYEVEGVTPGLPVALAARHLRLGKVFPVGANDWYSAHGSASNYLFKVRRGIIQEIGIANKRDTNTRAEQKSFLGLRSRL